MSVIRSSDLGEPKLKRVDEQYTISTHNLVPNGRPVSKKDITKIVNKIKKVEKENENTK